MNVVTISFGTTYWANVWLSETRSPFLLLLDQTHEVYRQFGLERSVWRSWGPKNLWYYASAVLRGEKLKEKRGDTNQLGGDFVVDQNGILRMSYLSQDPTDRPSIEAILQTAV